LKISHNREETTQNYVMPTDDVWLHSIGLVVAQWIRHAQE